MGAGSSSSSAAGLGELLVSCYPDRIARRRSGQQGHYLLASGRGARLHAKDPLAVSEYLVVPHLDAGRTEGRIFLAERLELKELMERHGELFLREEQVFWDDSLGRVVAVSRLRLQQLVIEERSLREVDPEEIKVALLQGINQRGLSLLDWNKAARQLQARTALLRKLEPGAGWPDLRGESLDADLSWLEPYLSGMGRAEQLKRVKLHQVFQDMLGFEKSRRLEQQAPVSFTVPSGSKIKIEYTPEETPVLAVRLQEMFGLTETPTIASGRVVLQIHLLSPARRPIQITSDLAGFWQNSYQEVRKEMRGRYPKHFWPDNPLDAKPTRGVKSRPLRSG